MHFWRTSCSLLPPRIPPLPQGRPDHLEMLSVEADVEAKALHFYLPNEKKE